jgi:DNA-binding MarR family transcriptional regulator/N-acetylglutamate synthase-like GNAT family acetyltransferase
MTKRANHRQIQAVRRFNRFYTRRIGVLGEGQLGSPFTLAEMRVLYELAQMEHSSAAGLSRELGLDPGYLSRILAGFERAGLLARTPAPQDGRRQLLSLTEAGRSAFAPLDKRSQQEIGALLEPLPPDARERLVRAMDAIERTLRDPAPEPFSLRPHRPGDMGWVVHRHGALYAEEYGWDATFEALVAEVTAQFIRSFNPERERCWIAERDGAVLGSVFLVQQDDDVAKLRLLFVEPSARGLGLGGRLVDECVRFAESTGYRTITLWTNSVLAAARRLYEARGFRLLRSEPHRSFGRDLVGETWERPLHG